MLCHTIDFFIDVKKHHLQYFDDFNEAESEITSLLVKLEERLRKEDKIGDGQKVLNDDQATFLSKIMQLLKHLIEFVAKENHLTCLEILNFALKFTNEDLVAIESYEIVQQMLQLPNLCDDDEISATLISKLSDILLIMDKLDFHYESIGALFKFLLDLLSKEKFEKVVLNSIHEGFFQQFLHKLTNYCEVRHS